MSFITSPISFGAYAFPYGCRISERQQDARLEELDIPYVAGQLTTVGLPAGKIFKITGQIGGDGAVDSSGAYITTRDILNAELNLMQSYLESGYQQLRVGDFDNRYILAQKAKSKISYDEANRGILANIDIELHAPDPRFLSNVTNSHDFGAGGSSIALINAGSVATFPVITFHGALVNPFIEIYPGQSAAIGNAIKARFLTTLVGGHALTVDCDPRNRDNAVLLDGVANLGLLDPATSFNNVGDSAFFPYMLAGSNFVVAGADSGSGDIVLAWQDAFAF